jgi:hypothetical protein
LQKFAQIYEAVEKLSIDPLYLKPANAFTLYLVYSKLITGFHGYIMAIMSYEAYNKVHALVPIASSAKDGM